MQKYEICFFSDLKSPNILFSGDVFKLGDFGSTQKVPEGGQLTTYTGSRNWCAPEKLNKEPYGVEAEVFELGNVLYEVRIFLNLHKKCHFTKSLFKKF